MTMEIMDEMYVHGYYKKNIICLETYSCGWASENVRIARDNGEGFHKIIDSSKHIIKDTCPKCGGKLGWRILDKIFWCCDNPGVIFTWDEVDV